MEAIKAQKKVGDIRGVAYSYIGMAYALRKEGQLAEALKHYQLSIDLSEKLGEKGHSMAAAAFNGMGSLFTRRSFSEDGPTSNLADYFTFLAKYFTRTTPILSTSKYSLFGNTEEQSLFQSF